MHHEPGFTASLTTTLVLATGLLLALAAPASALTKTTTQAPLPSTEALHVGPCDAQSSGHDGCHGECPLDPAKIVGEGIDWVDSCAHGG